MMMQYSKATQLILDQLQFKKPPEKYPTLEYMYQIEEFYHIDNGDK